MIGRLPTGTRGFDCNWTVTPAMALKFRSRGYAFVMRYVRRAPAHSYDLTVNELAGLLRAGLAVSVVQHVAPPGWRPTKALGAHSGDIAADEAGLAGLSLGCSLWCDLEEVAHGTKPGDVIDYCNAWYDIVKASGYDPGLYVGYGAGLCANDLYYRLRFARYWGAYNLDLPDYPAVRGLQIRQFAAATADHVPGVSFDAFPFDVNLAGKDALGDMPTFMLPPMLA